MAKARKSKSIRKSKRNQPAQLESQDCALGLSVVHPKAAGIDIGNEDQGGHTSELGPGAGTSLQLLYLGFDSPGELAEEPWH